jgi:serine/threonine protein kinase
MIREDFNQMMGNLKDLLRGKLEQQHAMRVSTIVKQSVTYKLEDLTILNILGEGAFGKVKLVKSKTTGECYALKAQGKQFVIENDQQTYVLNELRLMRMLKHPCVLTLHCAFQDSRYIYFLLDLLPGGELMNILQAQGKFNEQWTRFYVASVLLAYTELRKHNVAYRDLKPENMVLDAKGYCVLVDLGLAKQLDGPTFTFCGTPDYIAPEIIRGTGYTLAVDYWSLGVLLVSTFSHVARTAMDGQSGKCTTPAF